MKHQVFNRSYITSFVSTSDPCYVIEEEGSGYFGNLFSEELEPEHLLINNDLPNKNSI